MTGSQSFKLIQLSDLHLPADPVEGYRGLDVDSRLQRVLQHISLHHPDCDALLLSGDLVHHGGEAAYQRLLKYLEPLSIPCYWIPGNHDDQTLMRQLQPQQPATVDLNGWRMVLCDSCSEPDGRGGGALADAELRRIESELYRAQRERCPLVLAVHHNPVPLGSDWQDAIMLSNAERLWALFDEVTKPQAILCGHVHQAWDLKQNAVQVLCCPATSVQFVPGQPRLMLETEGKAAWPGYRWLVLPPIAELDQGKPYERVLNTGIERVPLQE